MPNQTDPAFQRRQEEQRQQQRSAAAQAAQARVQAHRKRATASIVDQMRPLQEQHMRQWQDLQSRYIIGADLDTDAARIFHNPAYYTAGVDPINCSESGSATFRLGDFTLTTGRQGHAELDCAIQERITQERARPTPSYDMGSTVARYRHLLTALDQQRLGYVAPPPTPVDGQEVHSLSSLSVAMQNPWASRLGDNSTATAWVSGDGLRQQITHGPPSWERQKAKGTQPVANFLAPPPGPTDQELAAADEWLRTSPWG